MNRLIGALLILGTVLPAQVPLRVYRGEAIDWQSARDLGCAGLSRSPFGAASVFDRPAVLGFVRRPGLELTYGLGVQAEQRTRVVFDQFENAIGEAVYADNTGAFGLPGPFAGVYTLPGRVAVGAGLAPRLAFDYRYRKEFRDDFYELIGEDLVVQSGTVFAAQAGAGFAPFEWLSVGAGGGYLFGARELEVRRIRVPDTTWERESGAPAGITYRAGFAARPVAQVTADFGFVGPITLANWTEGDDADDSRLPWQAQAGLEYRAPGVLPSVVAAAVRYEAWRSVDSAYSNLLLVRVGVEHKMLNQTSVRYGFGVDPSAEDPTVQTVRVGAGVGFDAGPFLVDVGAMFRREVITAGLFRGGLTPDDQRVYRTGAMLAVTLSRSF